MRAEYIQPFLLAAKNVLQKELGIEPRRGELSVQETYYTTKDITVLIGIAGKVEGTVLYGISESVGKKIAFHMLGENRPVFDELCESAIAELGNMISGHAAAIFEEQGLSFEISPPTLIVSRGTLISNMAIKRLVIPLDLGFGELEIAVSMREKNLTPAR